MVLSEQLHWLEQNPINLGCASYRPVMIPHPAASRSAEWLRDWADRSTPTLLENLMGS